MGCDIHLHIEVKIDEKWEHYSAPSVSRFYRMFEKMAGVRGSVNNAISPPKGIPSDISVITKLDYRRWQDDAHSESWLDLKEIQELDVWLRRIAATSDNSLNYDLEYGILKSYLFSNSFTSLPENIPEVTDVRFVFWFDC